MLTFFIQKMSQTTVKSTVTCKRIVLKMLLTKIKQRINLLVLQLQTGFHWWRDSVILLQIG